MLPGHIDVDIAGSSGECVAVLGMSDFRIRGKTEGCRHHRD